MSFWRNLFKCLIQAKQDAEKVSNYSDSSFPRKREPMILLDFLDTRFREYDI